MTYEQQDAFLPGRVVAGRALRRALLACASAWLVAADAVHGEGTGEMLVYHEIQIDDSGNIIPWYSENPGISYDHGIDLVFNWWIDRDLCPNGVPYYLQHQVWTGSGDPRGLGGDQPAMALSSWNLLHAYSGNPAVLDNMVLIADYYLDHSLSGAAAAWPNLPYPYNWVLHSGEYDSDMMRGVGILQPDKAGSFACELLTLYEITGTTRYLDAATTIADTLAATVAAGDANASPWPFRVNAASGAVTDAYTTNWTGTLKLFDELIRLDHGNVAAYAAARDTASAWLKAYPMTTNSWGPFFEDVGAWSDTEINADTLATYVLEHPTWSPTWQSDARAILDWSYATFQDNRWSQYGAVAIKEQTAYMVPGNSHTARHWAVELLYAETTGDTSRKDRAIRGLNWATYMVDFDGKNEYPESDVWLTDGYGDYVRHYLRAMASAPELAPAGESHLLRTSSVVRSASYACSGVTYGTYDPASREILRLGIRPLDVSAGGVSLPRLWSTADLESREGYTFGAPGDPRGVLRIRHDHAGDIAITAAGSGAPQEVDDRLGFLDNRIIAWTSYPRTFAWNLYRGSITGAGWSYDHTCFKPRLDVTRAVDGELPTAGSGFYYLVSGVNACGEGTLGAASDGTPRPLVASCP